MKATGLSNRKKKGKKDFLLYNYVIKNVSIDVEQTQHVTWFEQLSGIFRMLEDPALPQIWVLNIRCRLLDITEMVANWECEMVLLWSERVFSKVNDGLLKDGWADRYAIKDIQRDIFAVGVRLSSEKSDKKPEQNNPSN